MKLLFDHNLSPRLVSCLADIYPKSNHLFREPQKIKTSKKKKKSRIKLSIGSKTQKVNAGINGLFKITSNGDGR